jgi:salicylate hydroxylase
VKSGVLIAGAGIGGLTAALALARCGIEVALFEQAEQRAEAGAGAGVQLSPNATSVLIALDLFDRLMPAVVIPEAIRLRAAVSGREIAILPLDAAALARYGAPYWVMHRADLQKALLAAVADTRQITLTFAAKVEAFAMDSSSARARITCRGSDRVELATERGASALVAADGLWSGLRAQLGDRAPPRFAGRSAWRTMVPIAQVPLQFRGPFVDLWIGPGAHLVHYPVRAGAAVNVVAVAADRSQTSAWSTDAAGDEVMARFPARNWARAARDLLAASGHWQKWAIYDRHPAKRWGYGPVTLLGDAAHPMLPFVAQGAAMAIEDAAVLANELARSPDDPVGALRAYESARQPRTALVQRAARRNNLRYHMRQPLGFIRDAALWALGGERLLAQYDWIYRWRA